MLFDNFCAFVSLLIAVLIVEQKEQLSSVSFWWIVLETMLVNLFVMILLDTYHSVLHHTAWEELGRLLSQTGHLVLILLIFQLLNPTPELNVSKMILFALPMYLFSCFIMRQTYKEFLKKKHHLLNRHSLLIALEASQIPTVIPRILRSNYGIYRFTGFALMGTDPSEKEARQALRMLREQ